MSKKGFLALFYLAFFFNSVALFSDGMLFPIDPERPERILFNPRPEGNFTVPLSVTYHRVKVDIKENAAETQIDQGFFNHQSKIVEGLYMFPLPVGASISGFAMDIDGKMTQGELLDADKARSIYEDIVKKMQDPGLLEYVGTGLFKTHIYPIEPLKEKKVRLTYQEALKIEGGMVRYLYPLNTEKFSHEPLKEVVIEVKISSKLPITTIYSPTHKISVKRNGENSATVSFEANNVRPDKDFILYYAVAKKDISISLLTHRPDLTEDGTFLLMLSPRSEIQQSAIPSKNIAFVFDTSGSMAGARIDQAKKALQFCINTLKEGDRFFLQAFATEPNPYKTELLEVNKETKAGAIDFVNKLEPVGGTNIAEAILSALKVLEKSGNDRPSFIFFLTDGKPTVGLTDTNEILREIREKNTNKARIFVFGVGNDVNTALLDKLSEEHGGASDYVSETEDIETKVSELFTKLSYPVMVDVTLDFKNVEVSQVYPQRIPDIFKGSHVMLLGRYKKPGDALITLSGSINNIPTKIDFEASFPEIESENGFVAKIWATRKIGFLLDQIRKSGANEELKNEIVLLAKRYGILTPYTSFLVMEDKNTQGPNLRHIMMPSSSQIDNRAFEESRMRFSTQKLETEVSGADAINAAREVEAMKSVSVVPQPATAFGGGFSGRVNFSQAQKASSVIKPPEMREIAEKTFYLIDGKWIDSKVDKDKADFVIKIYSNAYFELLKKYPKIGKFLSLGERLKFVIESGKIVEIDPDSGLTNASEITF